MGSLRALASHYPEQKAVCHQVLVHPPGGLVGGDTLDIDAELGPGAHALITTPGAGRFYRSNAATATQTLRAQLAPGARLEWLPQETLVYDGCLGENRSRFELAAGAELISADVLALGLPSADAAFSSGRFTQHIELPGVWLERGVIAAGDRALRLSRSGLNGHGALGTLLFAAGSPIAPARRDRLLESARLLAAQASTLLAGATAPNAQVVVLRVLGQRTEPITSLLRAVWAQWRQQAWSLPVCVPRVWAT